MRLLTQNYWAPSAGRHYCMNCGRMQHHRFGVCQTCRITSPPPQGPQDSACGAMPLETVGGTFPGATSRCLCDAAHSTIGYPSPALNRSTLPENPYRGVRGLL